MRAENKVAILGILFTILETIGRDAEGGPSF
jgi:hypothetical protein